MHFVARTAGSNEENESTQQGDYPSGIDRAYDDGGWERLHKVIGGHNPLMDLLPSSGKSKEE